MPSKPKDLNKLVQVCLIGVGYSCVPFVNLELRRVLSSATLAASMHTFVELHSLPNIKNHEYVELEKDWEGLVCYLGKGLSLY